MMGEDRKMITDMNDRERQRFIAALRQLSAQAAQMVEALESGDDMNLVAPSMLFMLTFTQLQDLFGVIASAQWIDVSDLDRPLPEDPEDV